MPIIYTWEFITQAFKSMYEQMKDAESENGRNYAYHAEGMLTLIPQIRELPEFENFDLDMSMGKLMCKSKSGIARIYLGCRQGFIYFMESYEKQSGYSDVKQYSSEQIVPALQATLKQFTPE